MPTSFDMRGASIGNLILTSGFLDNRRHLDPVIFIFSKLVNVLGTVRPVVSSYLHLVAELENGKTIVGQHRLTGKETPPLDSPIRRLYISESRSDPQPVDVPIRAKMRKLIEKATLICYPMGSFYSSLIANLLPRGVARAIANTPCPKVFIPNTGGSDPESIGLDINDQINMLLKYLHRDDDQPLPDSQLLNFVLLDENPDLYPGRLDETGLNRMGIRVIRCRLTSPESTPYIDEKRLVPVLLSLS
jgi:CofD-related protein of GAK system